MEENKYRVSDTTEGVSLYGDMHRYRTTACDRRSMGKVASACWLEVLVALLTTAGYFRARTPALGYELPSWTGAVEEKSGRDERTAKSLHFFSASTIIHPSLWHL